MRRLGGNWVMSAALGAEPPSTEDPPAPNRCSHGRCRALWPAPTVAGNPRNTCTIIAMDEGDMNDTCIYDAPADTTPQQRCWLLAAPRCQHEDLIAADDSRHDHTKRPRSAMTDASLTRAVLPPAFMLLRFAVARRPWCRRGPRSEWAASGRQRPESTGAVFCRIRHGVAHHHNIGWHFGPASAGTQCPELAQAV